MDVFEFAAMIEETPIKSRVIEYSRPAGPGEHGRPLACVSLTDVFEDGLSMVYSFYDPSLQDLSLGTFAILDHIEIAREAGLPYVYLGYWVPGSRKMGYKANFSGLEIYKGGQWVGVGDPADHSAALHPLSVEPIAEQVAHIALPTARNG
jgi:arginine-tRNA-protein transferase